MRLSIVECRTIQQLSRNFYPYEIGQAATDLFGKERGTKYERYADTVRNNANESGLLPGTKNQTELTQLQRTAVTDLTNLIMKNILPG